MDRKRPLTNKQLQEIPDKIARGEYDSSDEEERSQGESARINEDEANISMNEEENEARMINDDDDVARVNVNSEENKAVEKLDEDDATDDEGAADFAIDVGSSDDEDFIVDEDELADCSSEVDGSDEDDEEDIDSMNCANNVDPRSTRSTWQEVTGDMNRFIFDVAQTGPAPNAIEDLRGKGPVDFFLYFIDNEIMNLIVEETNHYVIQKVGDLDKPNTPNPRKKSRPASWTPTNPSEMKKFLGILIWMGLVRMPKLRDYWSRNYLYSNKISQLMSRNRFELLLTMLHVSRDTNGRHGDRLRKISTFTDALQAKFKQAYVPEENVCIDESNVPFRGRIFFRQYIPNKRHRYGIKIFKLCVEGGYTWAYKIYTGKEAASVSENVVCQLMEGLLDHGRTLYVDNWYISVALAKTMIQRNTHLVGTLRTNRKNNPVDVTKAKLRKRRNHSTSK